MDSFKKYLLFECLKFFFVFSSSFLSLFPAPIETSSLRISCCHFYQWVCFFFFLSKREFTKNIDDTLIYSATLPLQQNVNTLLHTHTHYRLKHTYILMWPIQTTVALFWEASYVACIKHATRCGKCLRGVFLYSRKSVCMRERDRKGVYELLYYSIYIIFIK